MRNKIFYAMIILGVCLLFSWQQKTATDYEKEIYAAEKAFENMAADKGIASAFYFFADDNAVIKRQNDTLVIGKDNILKFYQKQNLKNASVTWKPDFVSVSQSGDMAYTYGKYLWQLTTDSGGKTSSTGVFHTVWKRQKDGSWKYVWD